LNEIEWWIGFHRGEASLKGNKEGKKKKERKVGRKEERQTVVEWQRMS
jgi:hypothetical protein